MNLALALVVAALPAAAQSGLEPVAMKARDAAFVQSVLVDMNDGNPMGQQIVRFLEEQKVSVELAAQAEPVKAVVESGRTIIKLSDALPRYPRALGPLIARTAAEWMYAGMPKCSERAYMMRGAAARVWVELGGSASDLPFIEPLIKAEIPAVLAIINPWMQDDQQRALSDIGRLDGVPTIMATGDEGLEQWMNKRFTAFLWAEKPMRERAGLR